MEIESLTNLTESKSFKKSYDADDLKSTDKNKFVIKPENIITREKLNVDNFNINKIVKENDDVANSAESIDKTNESKKNTEEKVKQQFFHHRNFYLSQMNDFCNKIYQPHYRLSPENFKNYKTIPKCMMHTSRKICNCKPECIDSIWKDYKFDESCKLYDLENYTTDDSYVECINLKPGPLDLKDLPEYPTDDKSEFMKNLDNLCDDSAMYTSTKCIAYQLRDKCRNDLSCLEKDLIYNIKKNCPNKDYNNQVEEYQKILGIEIGNNNELTNNSSIRKLLSIEYEPLSRNEYNKDVLVSKNMTSTNEMVMISVVGIAVICLYGYFFRTKLANSKLKTCMFGAIFILTAMILVLLQFIQ